METPDLDDLLPDDLPQDGVYGLWLGVTTDAVVHLLKYRSNIAREFLLDRDNPFFDFVCERMGYDADGVRERIRRLASQDSRGRAIMPGDGAEYGRNPD